MKEEIRAQWIDEYVRGTASAETVRLLDEALCCDAAFRRYFLEYVNLDSELSAIAQGHALETSMPEALVCTKRRASHFRRWIVAAAAVLCAGVGVELVFPTFFNPPFARVVVWAGPDLGIGSTVRNQRLRFELGSIEFLTSSGARVVVEAPAEIQFESAQRLRLFRGKVTADCPVSAHGFTILTPEGRATDLGTQFGVDVPEAGAAEIHVFQGEVLAQPNGAVRMDSLTTGSATALAGGRSHARDLRSASFVRSEELPRLAAALAAGQRSRSDAMWRRIQLDASLVASFDFEAPVAEDGLFRVAQGRWPGSRAPEFVSAGDHLKTDAGGDREYPQLTMAAWVRIDRMGDPYQSLYHTNGWSSESNGQVHWMLTRESRMRLALRGNTLADGSRESEGFPDSISPVLSERGRWMHLATVYDSEARTVRFYINGEFDSETRQQIAWPARLGPAQIGNWNRSDRCLSGRVDELLLFGRAFNDTEIAELYGAGNPYR